MPHPDTPQPVGDVRERGLTYTVCEAFEDRMFRSDPPCVVLIVSPAALGPPRTVEVRVDAIGYPAFPGGKYDGKGFECPICGEEHRVTVDEEVPPEKKALWQYCCFCKWWEADGEGEGTCRNTASVHINTNRSPYASCSEREKGRWEPPADDVEDLPEPDEDSKYLCSHGTLGKPGR